MRGPRYRPVPSRRMTFLRILSFPWLSDTRGPALPSRGECQGRRRAPPPFFLRFFFIEPPPRTGGKTERNGWPTLLPLLDLLVDVERCRTMCNSSNSSLGYFAFGILEQEDARLDRCYFLCIYIYMCVYWLIGKILFYLLNFNIKYVCFFLY